MHENHRERMRVRFENQGFEHFAPHEVLETLLFYSIPRKNTNDIAHRLINTFGSFNNVLDAPVAELEKVEGMGHSSALYLKMIRESFGYYGVSVASTNKGMRTIEDCAAYLMAKLDGKRNEEVYMLCLDSKRSVINCVKLSEGDVCSANVSTRKAINLAINNNAVAVVLAHNHPGGFALPSNEDVQVTNYLATALYHTGIFLLDHIIVTNTDYVSLYSSKLYVPEELGIWMDRT